MKKSPSSKRREIERLLKYNEKKMKDEIQEQIFEYEDLVRENESYLNQLRNLADRMRFEINEPYPLYEKFELEQVQNQIFEVEQLIDQIQLELERALSFLSR